MGKRELVSETSSEGHVFCKFGKSQNRVAARNVIHVDRKENMRKNASLGDSSI